jgi:hypothetical protein
MTSNNSFTDQKVDDTFIWVKKIQQQGLSNVGPERLKEIVIQRVEENKVYSFFICQIKQYIFAF